MNPADYANLAFRKLALRLYFIDPLRCFPYVILGSCKQVTIGPTAVMGLLTYETCGNDFPSCAILTGFYAGIFELLMAILQLGMSYEG